jgi:hypothetical protein
MWRLVGFCCVAIIFSQSVSAQTADNLVPNGSFEQRDPGVARFPTGWQLEKGSPECFQLTGERPLDGRQCLELTVADEPGTLVGTDRIAVEPGATYRLRHHFRIDKSNLPGGQAVYVRARYRDAEGRLLDWRKHGAVTLNTGGWTRPTPHWRLRETDFTVPDLARSLELQIGPGHGWQGVLAVDGISIRPVVKAAFERPASTRAFQFTAEPSAEPVAGFTTVDPSRRFDTAGDFGWRLRPGQKLSRGQFASQPGYLTKLQSYAVRRMTFSCGLPDGRYVASIYMGALWRTSIETMNHAVEVDRVPVVNDVRDRDCLMDEEYFRYVHATLVSGDDVERGGLAVYDRYIRPRYRRHDFEVEVTGGTHPSDARTGSGPTPPA